MRSVSSGLAETALTAEMRRSGRAWKKLVAEVGESVCHRPAVARAVASGMQPNLYVGRYLVHHARPSSILIMTTDGVVKAAGFRRLNVQNRMECRQLGCSSRSSLGCLPKEEPTLHEATQAPRPQVVHHPFGATSALCHEGRLEKVWCDNRLCSVF